MLQYEDVVFVAINGSTMRIADPDALDAMYDQFDQVLEMHNM